MIHAHDVNQQVGELVRNARADAGMTQAELAARSDMSRASIANIEIGIQSISIYQLLCLANALNLEPSQLLPRMRLNPSDDPEARRLHAAYEAVLGTR